MASERAFARIEQDLDWDAILICLRSIRTHTSGLPEDEAYVQRRLRVIRAFAGGLGLPDAYRRHGVSASRASRDVRRLRDAGLLPFKDEQKSVNATKLAERRRANNDYEHLTSPEIKEAMSLVMELGYTAAEAARETGAAIPSIHSGLHTRAKRGLPMGLWEQAKARARANGAALMGAGRRKARAQD